jgi:DNA-binding response OmpR family regulator
MQEEFIILIAERNRHVRDFLRREFQAEGYRVQVARDGRELLVMMETDPPPDLLILDLEIPFTNGTPLLEGLGEKVLPLPIIIHSFLSEYKGDMRAAAFVEKSEDPQNLKTAVEEVLRSHYPHRFARSRSS